MFRIPFHVIGGPRVQSVLFLLNSETVCENIVALGFLPEVVKLDQLPNRPFQEQLLDYCNNSITTTRSIADQINEKQIIRVECFNN